MFAYASSFDQDLGWCVDDDVNLGSVAFYNPPCASTSCGVAQGDCGGSDPTPRPPTPQPTGCHNQIWAGDGYCDSQNNVASCSYDEGDCCASTCVPASYACGDNGYDCVDPSAPNHSPTPQPSWQPTWRPTPQPSRQPTPRPTPRPVPQPTPRPTPRPVPQPSPRPTFPQPTPRPTPHPTPRPTAQPTSWSVCKSKFDAFNPCPLLGEVLY